MSRAVDPELASIVHELRDDLLKAWGAAPVGHLIRVERALRAPVDPLAWLRSQSFDDRVYWHGRVDVRRAGVGMAHAIAGHTEEELQAALASIQARLAEGAEGLRYVGGLRFDLAARTQNTREDAWSTFGGFRFVLPRCELVRRGGHCAIALQALKAEGPGAWNAIEEEIDRIVSVVEPAQAHAAVRLRRRKDAPDHTGWEARVGKALEAILAGALEKIVLARETCFTLAEAIDPLSLLARLEHHSESAYCFCFQFAKGEAFLGATPELLYRREGDRIHADALAGTRPRGITPSMDTTLAQQLLSDDKELREHDVVFRSTHAALGRVCRSVSADPAISVLKQPTCQHLFRRVEGTLEAVGPDVDARILAALHPTPAVAGYPAAEAITRIRAMEPFDRGWYAGPVGWIAKDGAEFAVAIRSVRTCHEIVYAYAGAGLVRGSRAGWEWEELEHKIGAFLRAVTTEH